MQGELERRRDAEVAAAAAHGPEEILILERARAGDLAVGQHEIDGLQVVERHAVLGQQPAEAAAEREAADAGRADDPAGRREAVHLRLAIEDLPERAALGLRRARRGIDVHAAHLRQVDHHAAVDGRAAADVVPAAADGDLEPLVARELDRVDDVGHAAALGDERGTLVDEAVVHAPHAVVGGVGGLDDPPGKCRGQLLCR